MEVKEKEGEEERVVVEVKEGQSGGLREESGSEEEEEVKMRVVEVVKYMRGLRAAQHLDLASTSINEVYPR